jgi:iron complex transport system ATP-binding protein
MSDLLLHCAQLELRQPDGFVLGPLSLQLKAGKMYGLLGANGAGKSTLLQLLAGLKKPDRGEINLKKQDLSAYTATARARLLAFLSQQQAPTEMTVRQLLHLGLLPHKALWQRDNQSDRASIDRVLVETGLSQQADILLSHLSGGEQQRAHLARVLVQQARLLLLDEPVNHLDIRFQHQLLATLRRSGLCVLASFHDINLAATYCDELVLLQQGQMLAAGAPEQVLQPDLLQQVFGRPCLVDQSPFGGSCRVTFAPEPV